MIQSIWRFSHFFLACISVFFLIGASVSGAILSFSSIEQENATKQFGDLNSFSVAQLCDSLDKKYKETYSIEMKQGLAQVSLLTNEGSAETIYVNPINAQQVSSPKKESRIYSLSRIFHRSLLLKTTGRILVGISSLLLFFIAATGFALLLRRQGSLANVFKKISKDDFYTYWHAQLSRFFMIAIVLIALSGVYLSLERFEIVPGEQTPIHEAKQNDLNQFNTVKASDVPVFKDITLASLESLVFPFSPFPEDGDHFQIKTIDSDLVVDQFTGEVISTFNFGFQQKFRIWSYAVHTGKGSISWSVILCMACCSILFFIFTGLQISLKRLKYKKVNSFTISQSEYIILVGSENGNTMRYARSIYDLLILNGRTVFLDYLNNYKAQKHKHQLLVVTSTYGLGEAPANANKFLKKFNKAKHAVSFDFSVLGFGSRNYPDFCQFAIDVEEALMKESNTTKNTDIGLVDQQSKLDFESWKAQWCLNNGLSNSNVKIEENTKYDEFEVRAITNADLHPKLTFRLVLKANRNIEFTSGDLLAIRPKKGEQERLYSIGAGPNKEIVLYIKKHFLGACSQQLASLSQNSKIEARIVSNTKFHVPPDYRSLILISNGTGIAPFIGMAVENKSNARIDLFWGGKSAEDYKLYEEELMGLKANNQIRNLQTIFSLDKNQYVQQLIKDNQAEIAEALSNGTSIMICGSIAMGQGVLNEIAMICKNNNLDDIEFYKDNGQIKMDCY
tara:strand:- start:342 stop:2537 length:2196 start_codon:yes stop_codon:yes gene_type:complete